MNWLHFSIFLATVQAHVVSLQNDKEHCEVATPEYNATFLKNESIPELLICVHDWQDATNSYWGLPLDEFKALMDRPCNNHHAYRGRFVYTDGEQAVAHGILYNWHYAFWTPTLKTYSRNQKVLVTWREPGVRNYFPHPEVDVQISWSLKADIFSPFSCMPTEVGQNAARIIQVPNVTQRKKGIAAFISHCKDFMNYDRLATLEALMKYIHVDSYGKCLHNTKMPPTRDGDWYSTKVKLLREYRLMLAWENTKEDNYVSEKVFSGIDAGAVPVYIGAPDVERFVPKEWIINANNFTLETMPQLAAQLQRVLDDDNYYASFYSTNVNVTPPARLREYCKHEPLDSPVSCKYFDYLWHTRHVPAKKSRRCS